MTRAGPAVLPLERTSFVGRERELGHLADLLRSNRLITITGAGGSGKTRLALAVARTAATDFSDGVRVVPLAALERGDLAPNRFAESVGVMQGQRSDPTDDLVEHLSRQQLLLVVDNCEHVLDGVAAIVEAVLEGAPGVTIMATSRRALAVEGELRYPLAPLDVATADDDLDTISCTDSVRLFIDRAFAADPGFTLDENNAAAVARVCARVDGLPLAVELAAARIRSMSVDVLADRMETDIHVLGARRTAEVRHRTVRALLDWSHQLLDAPGAVLFRRFAVFQGGATLDAIESVCSEGVLSAREVIGTLDGLVDASLVMHENGRYRLLALVRDYSGEQLHDVPGEVKTVRDRHLAHYALLGAVAADGLRGPDPLTWRRLIDTEVDNFRSALAWANDGGDPDAGARLLEALADHWGSTGLGRDGIRIGELLLTRVSDSARVQAHAAVAWLATRCSLLRVAAEHGEMALALLGDDGDDRQRTVIRWVLGRTAWEAGDYEASIAHFGDGLDAIHRTGDVKAESAALGHIAQAEESLGRFDDAAAHYETCVRLARESGYAFIDPVATGMLAAADLRAGDVDRAIAGITYEINGARGTGDLHNQAAGWRNLAVIACYRGDFDEARRCTAESITVSRAMGHRWLEGWATEVEGRVACREGNYDEAIRCVNEALALSNRNDIATLAHLGHAVASAAMGRDGDAVRHAEQAQALARDPLPDTSALLSLLAARRGDHGGTHAHAGVALNAAYYPFPHERAETANSLQGLAMIAVALGDRAGRVVRSAIAAEAIRQGLYVGQPFQTWLDDTFGNMTADSVDEPSTLSIEEAIVVTRSMLDGQAEEASGPLTPREREIVERVAGGDSDAEIAGSLFISIRTVRSHLDRIKDKTGLRRRSELTRLAVELGLVADSVRTR